MSHDAVLRLAIFLGLFAILAAIEHFAPRRPRPQKPALAHQLDLRGGRHAHPAGFGGVFAIRRSFGRRRCHRAGVGPSQPDGPARLDRGDRGHFDYGSSDLAATFAEP